MKTIQESFKESLKNETFRFIVQMVVVALAGIVSGCVFKTFFEPQEIIPVGLSGLALIIHNLLIGAANIPTSIIYLLFNVILFSFAFKFFGWRFIVLSLVGAGAYTLAMQFGYIEALATASTEKLLFAFIGGMISGACVGIALRFGGSTGGSDVLGALINKKFPKIKTGVCILILNVLILTLSVIISGVQTGLYALVIAVITSMSTNMFLDSAKRVVAYYIICNKDQEIANAILGKYHRGITRIDCQGIFSKKEKKLLLCLVPYEESSEMKKLIKRIDKDAFVFSSSANETLGEGDFLKQYSVFKNKVRNADSEIKIVKKYKRHIIPRRKYLALKHKKWTIKNS